MTADELHGDIFLLIFYLLKSSQLLQAVLKRHLTSICRRVSRSWLNVHFWVNCPFNASKTSSPFLLHHRLYKYNIFWFLAWFTDDQVSSDLFSTFISLKCDPAAMLVWRPPTATEHTGTCPTQETKHKHLADGWPRRPPACDEEASWSHKFMTGSKNHLFLPFPRVQAWWND